MPIWLRSFYYKKIEEALKKQKKDSEEASKKSKPTKVSKPSIGPRK